MSATIVDISGQAKLDAGSALLCLIRSVAFYLVFVEALEFNLETKPFATFAFTASLLYRLRLVGRLTPQLASRNRSVIATSAQLVKPGKTGKQCKVWARRRAAFTKKHCSYAAATIRKARAPANGSGISAMYCATTNNSTRLATSTTGTILWKDNSRT
jgi:hypothetical protein